MTTNDKYSATSAALFLGAIIALFAITGCWPQDPAAPTPAASTSAVVSQTTEPDGTTVYTYEDGSTAGLIPPANP